MFCSKCGKEILEDSNFCKYCGRSVVDSSSIDAQRVAGMEPFKVNEGPSREERYEYVAGITQSILILLGFVAFFAVSYFLSKGVFLAVDNGIEGSPAQYLYDRIKPALPFIGLLLIVTFIVITFVKDEVLQLSLLIVSYGSGIVRLFIMLFSSIELNIMWEYFKAYAVFSFAAFIIGLILAIFIIYVFEIE